MSTRVPTARSATKRSSPAAAQPAAGRAVKQVAAKSSAVAVRKSGTAGAFLAVYKMDFTDKIHTIRTGVAAQRVGQLSAIMGIPKEALMDSLGLSRATINRKVQREQSLSPEESERVMGIEAMIGQVEAMIDTENAPEFDAAKWLANWLAAPLPALGGATPGSFMDTVEGQKYVGNLLEMVQSGAYA